MQNHSLQTAAGLCCADVVRTDEQTACTEREAGQIDQQCVHTDEDSKRRAQVHCSSHPTLPIVKPWWRVLQETSSAPGTLAVAVCSALLHFIQAACLMVIAML